MIGSTGVGRRALRAVFAVGVVAGAVCAAAGTAQAASNGSWAVYPAPPDRTATNPPSYFVLSARPGAVLSEKLLIENLSATPRTFLIYSADAYNTPVQGFFSLRGFDEQMSGVGRWVTLPLQRLTVNPHVAAVVPFTVHVPANAGPGSHVGGLVALDTAKGLPATQKGVALDIKRAVGVRLYITVPGPTQPALTVSHVVVHHATKWLPFVGPHRATVTYTVTNTGNLDLSPAAEVSLTGTLGGKVGTAARSTVADLLPGQSATLTASVPDGAWADRLTAHIRLRDSGGLLAVKTSTFWAIPWVVLALVALAGVAVAARRLLTRASKRPAVGGLHRARAGSA